MDLSTFKVCCDGEPISLQVKGSSILACFKSMVFTSNIHPRQWWPTELAPAKAAIMRRLKIVMCSGLSYDQIYEKCISHFQGDPTIILPADAPEIPVYCPPVDPVLAADVSESDTSCDSDSDMLFLCVKLMEQSYNT